MPLGNYPAGIGPAGHDPFDQADPAVSLQPVAMLFDLAKRDWTLLENGQYSAVHPNDQAVNISLGIERGAIKGDPSIGHELRKVRLGTPRTAGDVVSAVRASVPISSLIDSGAITEISIRHEVDQHGRLMVEFRYLNNELSENSAAIRRVVV